MGGCHGDVEECRADRLAGEVGRVAGGGSEVVGFDKPGRKKREWYFRFCASCTLCEGIIVDAILPHIIATKKGIRYPHLGSHVPTL